MHRSGSRMGRRALAAALVVAAACCHVLGDDGPTPAERAAALCAEMTLEERVSLLHGLGWGATDYVGQASGVARLGIPDLRLNDGPQGFRCNGLGKCPGGTSTQYPSGLTIAATWDRSAALQWGTSMGIEFYGKGANIQLGPGVCVARVPNNGRNFEYMSGEDPVLGRELVQPVVTGIQSQKVVATTKHYVLNNQETNRNTIDVNIDERTLFEMYLPPFAGAAKAQCGSFMCSYNKIGGKWSCEQNMTLNTDLRDHLGFEGFVMSDWRATHSTSILDGLDQEMPGSTYLNDKALASPALSLAVNQSVTRILLAMIRVGALDAHNTNSINANVSTPARMAVARQLSENSTVLLKNEGGLLPLATTGSHKIILVGKLATAPITGGGGSGRVDASYLPTPLAALTARLGTPPADCSATAFEPDTDFLHTDRLGAVPAGSAVECCAACGATPGCRFFSYKQADRTCYRKESDEGRRASAGVTSGACYNATSAIPEVLYAPDVESAKALGLGEPGSVGVVFVGTSSAEGSDRKTLSFGADQDALVYGVANLTKRSVVVAVSPGASLMPWAGSVGAILFPLMPGQMFGDSLAHLLCGDVAPSGKLPITLPNKDNEYGWTDKQWPGVNGEVDYLEGLFFGYRWYQKHSVKPLFPFGHGLSYTTFAYGALKASAQTVALQVTNNGTADGAEVVQLYLGFPESAGEPPRVLRGFDKVYLKRGESTAVQFALTAEDLSVWSAASHAWEAVSGTFTAFVGSSSADIRQSATFVA